MRSARTMALSVFLHPSNVAFFSYCHTAKKTAADDLFGEADDISSESDAEKPPTPGQPLVSICIFTKLSIQLRFFPFKEL